MPPASPQPSRPDRAVERRNRPSRLAVVLGLGVVVAALGAGALVVAALFAGGGAATAPLWSGRGVQVFPPVWADRILLEDARAWYERIFDSGGRPAVRLDHPALLVRHQGRFASGRPPEIVGDCGCRFEPSRVDWDARAGEGVASFDCFPRHDGELALDLGDDALVRAPNPQRSDAAAGDAPCPPVPLAVRVGDERWVLEEDAELRSFVVRGIGSDDRPLRWAMDAATFQDAEGNAVSRAAEPEALQHVLWKPLEGPFHLCPHEPWWQLDLEARTPDGGSRRVSFRFRPPPPPPAAPPR